MSAYLDSLAALEDVALIVSVPRDHDELRPTASVRPVLNSFGQLWRTPAFDR